MPVAQTKSSELIDILNELRDSELDPFTISRLKRDISKLSDYDERYMFSGMLEAVLGNLEETINNFNRSLQLNFSYLTCDNFVIALGNLCEYALAREKIIEFSLDSHDPALLKLAFHYSYMFLDIDNCVNNFEILKKLKVTTQEQECIHDKEVTYMTQLIEAKLVSSENLLKIGTIAMMSIESHNLNVTNNTISLQCEDDQKLRVKYYVEQSTDTDTILGLNDHFIDNLIDEDLDLLPVVVTFVRNDQESSTTEQDQQVEVI